MEPIDRETQGLVLPISYEEYLKLCQTRGIAPQLDKPTFDLALEDRKMLRSAYGFGELESSPDAADYLEGLSNEQILRKLGVALHLDELVSTTKNS